MSHDPLEDLLRLADAAAGPPPAPPAGLARRVRRAVRGADAGVGAWTGAAAGLSLVLGLGVFLMGLASGGREPAVNPGQPGAHALGSPVASSAHDTARMSAELAGLRNEARTRTALVKALLGRERLDALRARLARIEARRAAVRSLDLADRVQRELDRAADISLRHADRLCRDLKLPGAAAAYRRVVDLFPNTPGAAVARRRLADYEKPKGEV